MANIKQTHEDYENILKQQVSLLVSYCESFDRGDINFALPISTSLRVLLHQTNHSTSLLTSLNKADDIEFLSTCDKYIDLEHTIFLRTLISTAYKTSKFNRFHTKKDLIIVPNLNINKKHKNWVSLNDWYNMPIFIANKNNTQSLINLYKENENDMITISRKAIILYFCNKAGGAHASDKVNKELYMFSKNLTSLIYDDIFEDLDELGPGSTYQGANPLNNSLHCAVRQIAHETILSLKKEFDLPISYYPKHNEYQQVKVNKPYGHCAIFYPDTRELYNSFED